MPLNQPLTACVVCQRNRGIKLAELLAKKFFTVHLIQHNQGYQFWKEGIKGDIQKQLPESVNAIFIHQSDYNLLNDRNIVSRFIFKFTSDGEPHVQGNELPIYRQVLLNQLNIEVEDVEEIVAYINQQQVQKPRICLRTNNITEWRNLVETVEFNNLQNRHELLNYLLCNILRNSQERTHEYYDLYRFLGSPQPIVYVLDDYRNYTTYNNDIYKITDSNIREISKYYRDPETDQNQDFTEVIKGFCLILNNLSIRFDVKAIELNFPASLDNLNVDQLQPTYELIYHLLNLNNYENQFHVNAAEIAAFIVDIEWLPNITDAQTQQQTNQEWWKKWKQMGVMAIDILSQRYPEIPCYILTGSQPINELQEGLVHRAYWGFEKPKSHHYKTGNDKQPSELLNCITLEQHLVKAVNRRYGSYQKSPFQQLNIHANSSLWQKLIKKLNIQLPLEQCVRGQALIKLIAGLFPTAQQVEPIKILSGGKSQAQATFLVSPICENNRLATRFIKIGSWFLIQKEYLAYQKVIQPRLNSYTANIIQRPILTEVEQHQMSWGALMYTLAGFPEEYDNLQSLHELFKQHNNSAEGAIDLLKCVKNTLEKVLFPLYKSSFSQEAKTQPVWCWLGDGLPPIYTGVLIPLIKLPGIDCLNENTVSNDIFVIPSAVARNSEGEESWRLAFSNLQELNTKLDEQYQGNKLPELSLEDLEIVAKDYQKVLLSGWKLMAVEVPGNSNEGELLLVHPILGMRVFLRGDAEDIRLRFGATWLRPGMTVNVLVYLDTKTQRLNNTYKNLSGVDYADNQNNLDLHIREDFKRVNQIDLALRSPVEVFYNDCCHPDNYLSVTGHAAPIHGDLNLNNILYAAGETVGWLIDFERVKTEGLAAYDLAKLEGEIWTNHLLVYINELAKLTPNSIVNNCYKLLYFCLQSLEFLGDEAEFFKTKVRNDQDLAFTSDGLLMPIINLLKVIKLIRDFGVSKCQITLEEMKWSLSAYFLNAAKLNVAPHKRNNAESSMTVFQFLISAWHLAGIVRERGN
ncbi:aminoglycoside phosphotransferase family protein [Nodularia sphaerocarpa]|uniref:aminoglycoside phosphotransferase family protein n=1 Tax=Nodularia sphaerocarpa TaxID=137816 RepID=UPI001EFB5419|nr:aminoglycoside phosphotransferase family protein [Nodularia sphaerocarpa]MDB9375791.1 aminoglycoside phosphotransferase family protein [Nodularia sphaerocarpa CS-585]MDB9378122.1 aminoglycoside phosphotransferase family protein [Nodularia sphaerocarpa CS-585A2]ULP71892.1 hypothetical protein BDGGKGIB_01529 [Nodularia sphaerocarpa UHCC 0038]